MSDVGGLQLLPSQKKRINFSALGGNNTLFTVAVGLLIAVGIVFGILKYLTNKTITSIDVIDAEIGEIHKARDKTQEERLLNFDQQAQSTKALLRSHTVWVDGFGDFQKLIEPRISFISLSADATKRTFLFHALADGYSTVAKQIASLYRSDLLSDITLNKASDVGNGRVDFTMELKFKQNHFLIKDSNE